MSYLHPGVYIEEIPSGVRPIGGVSTSVAALVGPTTRGTAGVPILVRSFEEYKNAFGELTAATDVMGLAVLSFFQNGGSSAYVVAAKTDEEYQTALDKLLAARDVNILLLPGQTWAADGTGNKQLAAALAHCEQVRNRMLIVDPAQGKELTKPDDVDGLKLPTSTFSVTYYPWVKVANPLYNPITAPTEPSVLTVAPGPFAAGIWARTDGTRGVWKAPAGVEAALIGAAGLEFSADDGTQDSLNPKGVNCLRALPGYGTVIWGSRTLATNANPEWRYVPVRRTALFLEESVRQGIQWAVFEPNDHRLWSSLRLNISSFLNGLFRAGAFQGEKASDAYFVRCGLGDTMTQGDIDAGQVIVLVGFAPLKPAEFVIVRIQQKVQQ